MTGPVPLGARRAFGFGDALGFAGPAALAAVRDSGFAPIFAQQSPRELAETGRAPADVLAAAPAAGGAWGADADAVTTAEQARVFVSAGFTRITIDPSAYFVEKADTMTPAEIDAAVQALEEDGVFLPDWLSFRPVREVALTESVVLRFSDDDLRRVAVKFGWALAYAAELAAHAGGAFEVEFSALAATSPTTPLEHWFIAQDCRHRGLPLVAFAPRLPGAWELAADYTDDLDELARALAFHTAIAAACGPHQVSIAGIEEKRSVLPLIGRVCGERLHAKTSATSTLAALRVVARVAPATFRELLVLAQEFFPFAHSAHAMSLTEDEMRFLPDVEDGALEATFLDHAHGRQLLAATFGAIWGRGVALDGQPMRDRVGEIIQAHAAEHDEVLGADYRTLLALLRRG